MERFTMIGKKDLDKLPKKSGVYCFVSGKETIYIGKAINIQSRVKNHFNQPTYKDELYKDSVDSIGFFETDSEIEALVLEANLIKKYQPKFNAVWRDDKNYFYVAIKKSEKPIIYITHQKNEPAEYIGPFVEGTALKKTLRFLRHAFPFYTSKNHPKNKCTYCHLGLCPGPTPDLKEYKKNIKKLTLILKGKRNAALLALRKEMKQHSKENNFEEAGKIRDRLFALQQIMAHTHVIGAQGLFQEAQDALESTANAEKWQNTEKILQGLLEIKKPISKIECYDISNTQGNQAVGSMVVFVKGAADRHQYKKFRIRRENTPNDIAMLKEVIARRLNHPEWKYPEIMLIDGGIAQLNVAIGVKNEKRATRNIHIISIAKRNPDLYIEGKKGFVPLKTLPREIYNLVLQLDDEAHRFAITYHKKLRKQNLLK